MQTEGAAIPARSFAMGLLLGGLTVLCWQVSGSERQVVCSRSASQGGLIACTESESGPMVPKGHRITEYTLLPSERAGVARLQGSRGTSLLWSLVVMRGGVPAEGVVDRSDPTLVLASGGSKAWAMAQNRRLAALEEASSHTAVVFEDRWRGPGSRWAMSALALGFLGLGGFDLRHRARAGDARAPLLWAAGLVGGLLGASLIGALLS